MKSIDAHTPINARLGLPKRLSLGLLLLTCCVSPALASSASAAGAPLSPSAYAVSHLCATASPGHSGCLGLRLVARDPLTAPAARALPAGAGASRRAEQAAPSSPPSPPPSSPPSLTEFPKPIEGSLTPANVLSAYSLTGISPPSPQTIALVDAYDSATIAADLEVFDSQFGLPACNEANGCFRKVNQAGGAAPLPPSSGEEERGWAQEIATDVEVAHGVCQSCRVLLVEAESNYNSDLYAAEQTAVALGAGEISNSWGGEEPEDDSPAFDHPGSVITASSGDSGYLNWLSEEQPATANYPASSPHVVAVGGTRLALNKKTKAWEGESAWNDGGQNGKGELEGAGAGGGGCSELFAAPPWQVGVADWSSVGCVTQRAVADVSADADPYAGVAVYDSTPVSEEGEEVKGWGVIGGTSVASPIVASAFALAGGAQGVEYPARTLYENELRNPASLHDVISGSNGECLQPFHRKSGVSGCTTEEEAKSCSGQAICLSFPGYDGPTGVGTPAGIGAFRATGAGGEPPPPPATTQVQPVTGVSAPGATRGTSKPIVSALRLTRSAIVALHRKRPKVSKVGFSFSLSAPARIRVTISKRVRVRGHMRWKVVSKPFTILAGSGRQTRRLSGHEALARGRYRLTLTPTPGTPKSIVFQIG